MIFAVLFEDMPGVGMEVRTQYMPAHLDFLTANKKLISAAGPLKQSDGSPAGGLWLVKCDDEQEVQKLVEEDPFWRTGLRKSVKILSWGQVFANGERLASI